jgi:hypothetical protein
VTSDEAAGRAAVLLSSSAVASDVADKFAAVDVPVVSWGLQVLKKQKMADSEGAETNPTNVSIDAPTHALAGGLSGSVNLWTDYKPHTWASSVGSGAIIVASFDSDPTKVAVLAYDTGASMFIGIAPARRVALPAVTDDVALNGTAQLPGGALFDAAITWATAGRTDVSLPIPTRRPGSTAAAAPEVLRTLQKAPYWYAPALRVETVRTPARPSARATVTFRWWWPGPSVFAVEASAHAKTSDEVKAAADASAKAKEKARAKARARRAGASPRAAAARREAPAAPQTRAHEREQPAATAR